MGDGNMLMKMSEFLKTLPPKKCTTCGKSMHEQHECYTNKCETCNKI
ncbi:MAG: protein YhfH [Bacillaceae bacterium]